MREDVDRLAVGLYRLYWKSGGHSLAAVGMLYNGERWFAPVNWTSPTVDGIACKKWAMVERAEPLARPRRSRVWDPGNVAKLGTIPDQQLAEELGLGRSAVTMARLRRRIPAHGQRRSWTRWTQETIALLGTLPDPSVAALLGITHQAVAGMRKKLGVARYAPPGAHAQYQESP